MERRFRVLRQFKYRLMDGIDIPFKVGYTGNTLFFFSIHEDLLRDGFIEEITPIQPINLTVNINVNQTYY